MQHWLAHPLGLALLAALPLLGSASWLARRRRRRVVARLGSVGALDTLTDSRGEMGAVRGLCLSAALVALAVGMAGPQWGRDQTQATAPGRDVVVVLDVSRSMLAEDVLGKSAPNRLGRAKDALIDLVDTIKQRGGHRLALVVFAARARVVCPLTHDYDHFRFAVDRVDPVDLEPLIGPSAALAGRKGGEESGTRIGNALETAVQLHDERFHTHQDILLLSDGDDPAGDEEWRNGIAAARQQGIPVHTVAVGDPDKGSPIPTADGAFLRYHGQVVLTRMHEEPLEAIARLTGGVVAPAGTKALPLGQLFRENIEPRGGREDDEDVLPTYRRHDAWFFAAAVLFLVAHLGLGTAGRRQKLRSPVRKDEAPAVPPKKGTSAQPLPRISGPDGRHVAPGVPTKVAAVAVLGLALVSAAPHFSPDELVRRGNAAFDAADYAAAVTCFEQAETYATDPGLVAFDKAAALYRLGNYREAERHYLRCLEGASPDRRARALYDAGNAVLQQAQGRDIKLLERAIGLYHDCLLQGTADQQLRGDATNNLELAEALKARASARPPDQDDSDPNDSTPAPGTEDRKPAAGPGTDHSLPRSDPNGKAERVPAQPGDQDLESAAASEQPQPGMNPALPPIPDKDDLVRLSPEDTEDYLQQAAERIVRERQEHRHRRAAVMPPNVKDW